MADLLEMAKQLGRELQKDERYLAFRAASEENDKDSELQNLIGEFNLKRLDLGNEEDKAEHDVDRVKALGEEVRTLYSQIMAHKAMQKYQAARAEFEQLLDGINRVIAYSAAGQDPDSFDPAAASGCSGNCSACAGCH
ncbi:MAG: YlbF family regulator [Oscillospiraceae bacterium]|nr:YlbF family regulator [Oscillospiraceae bacterium]